MTAGGINQQLKARLDRSFGLTHDLVVHLDEEALGLDLPDLPSNRISGQVEFAFGLLEHEIQHHGQLIRLVYGNRLSFPKSWHQRYTV